MVFQADAVVAPDEGCAACATTGGYARAAFARFAGFAGFGHQPVEGSGGGGEGAGGECGSYCERAQAGCEAWRGCVSLRCVGGGIV